MLAYAANRRSRRKLSPATLALIIGGHAAALALLISAKTEVSVLPKLPPLIVDTIPLPPEPQPAPPPPEAKPIEIPPPASSIDTPPTRVILPLDTGPVVVDLPVLPNSGPIAGTNPQPLPQPVPTPIPDPKPLVRTAAALATPADLLRPPYPESKRRLEEEAVLRLRITINERGRVTSVEPVGSADAAFLSAARQHLVRHWRYKPATEDGRAVATTLTISLRFRLEDA